jgi:GNAT superfamily N-acetyltransferase
MKTNRIANEEQAFCSVRQARSGDLERMAELAGQLGYACGKERIHNRLQQMQNPQQHAVFVAETRKGEIVGWIGTQIFRSVELDPFAEISGLIVDEKSRSCGIGKLLVAVAEDWARTVGSEILCVRSNVIRERAHRFYTNNGFEEIKIQKIFSKTLR